MGNNVRMTEKKNVMGVDYINIVIYTYSIHTKRHLYQILVLRNHVFFSFIQNCSLLFLDTVPSLMVKL